MISHVILKQDEPYRLDFAATSRGDAPARDFIRELRVSFGRREIRLLYFIHGRTIVLTHGFLKKTRALPPEEIVRAERLRALWLSSPEEYS
jgi:phage-related protein